MLEPAPTRTLDARGLPLKLGGRTLVMGVINMTPDSFSDGGLYADAGAAVQAGLRMIEEGADIVDVGGESTRPGYVAVDAGEETQRALPVIAGLVEKTDIPVSIDTYKAAVAKAALKQGARMVNDVWGLQRDPDMARVVAASGAAVVIMHNRERAEPNIDILDDIRVFFANSLARARAAGIREDRIVLDPGIGFGKTLEQNLAVLARLDELHEIGFPILIGTSRKSFIGRLSPSEPRERLPGTLAANVFAVLGRVAILRVHDVAAQVQALRVAEAIRGAH
ncbi:MAG TPA: dihydropteroate synthase [Xanthobacteraceae bacterium]